MRSGQLAGSITVFDVTDLSVTFGSNLIYAAQVHFGGIIEPVPPGKALAIPLNDTLQRQGIGPRELDPGGDILRFQPYMGSKPNVFGLLVDDEVELTGRQKKKRGTTSFGPGPLYALAYWVNQPARPYLGPAEEDVRVITDELWPAFLETA